MIIVKLYFIAFVAKRYLKLLVATYVHIQMHSEDMYMEYVHVLKTNNKSIGKSTLC